MAGTVAFPPIDAAAVKAYAAALRQAAQRLELVDDDVDRIAQTARGSWRGDAAAMFGHHMNDRGHAFELAAARTREAAQALDETAASVERARRAYDVAVIGERYAIAPADRVVAIGAQALAARSASSAAAEGDATLASLAALVQSYTDRSFFDVGDATRSEELQFGPAGRDLIIDSLLATQEDRIAKDEIQIRQLDDGSYVVVLPGVTDLTSNVGSPWNWYLGGPQDTVRKVANARPTATDGGPNPYADAVKIAMQRAGIPEGADVTFVGHSYGSYTSIDLASDDAFNSADGTSRGYNVRVRAVYGFGADVDWKMRNVPAQTDVVSLNSRDDIVYRTETRFHPEPAEVIRRQTQPLIDFVPVPVYRPVTTRPSGRPNQVDVEVNGGRQWNADDGFYSGHHQRNYSRSVPQVGDDVDALYQRMNGRRVLSTVNVRVPDGPRDTVPPPR